MTRISLYAKLFPRQFLGPRLNGWEAARWSLKNGEEGSAVAGGSQRSGMKAWGRWKLEGLWEAVQAWTPTLVC